jgi:hypothetical protein
MGAIEELQPTERLLVMNLLDQAGVDVSAWALGKGGARKAASNPMLRATKAPKMKRQSLRHVFSILSHGRSPNTISITASV